MPFTFSHPAIVIPLKVVSKKYFSLTALAIGSMAPDFEYFLRMKVQGHYGHTILGIFWFDLPLTLLLSFVFHNIVRKSLYENIPTFFKSRVKAHDNFNWNEYFKNHYTIVLYSAIIGISSHIFWDSFTHKYGYFVELFDALQNSVEIVGKDFPVYKILQHTSTLIGALVILYSISKMSSIKIDKSNINLKYWASIFALTIVFVGVRFLIVPDYANYGNVIVSFLSSFMLSLIVTPLIIKNVS